MKSFFTRLGLILLGLVLMEISNAQISGTVFRDYNGDGVKNSTAATGTAVANNEPGIPGVVINAYNAVDVLIASQTTGANGFYSFSIGSGAGQIPNATQVRLECVLPQNCIAHSAYDFMSTAAGSYGSNVQFKTQSIVPATANFAVNTPAEYRGGNSNPKVFIPRHMDGDPLASPAGNAATEVAMYSFNYTASGQSTTGNNARTSLATAAQIGTCWGVAYSKFSDRIYTSAVLKRHSAMGPGGPSGSPSPVNAPGSIYMVNPNISNSGSFFFSLDALGAAYFTHDHTSGNALYIKTNTARNILPNIGLGSTDSIAFSQAGKAGIGDIELSEDGRYLWLTNLYDRKLYRIDLINPVSPVAPTPATAASVITKWDLPAVACTNSVLRPWGLKAYKGDIYVGAVCTGETDPNANNASFVSTNYNGTTVTGGSFNVNNSYIFQLDPAGAGTWATILTIPLNYPRGNTADENFDITRWYNWTNNFDALKAYPGAVALIKPQPILSNIEFDTDGTMMIAFMDRLGLQVGKFVPDLNGNGGGTYYGEVGGDLLRAYNNGCTYQLESNSKEGAASSKPTTAGKDKGQGLGSGAYGPGGANYGEFYWNERFFYTGGNYFAHNETSLGTLAFIPGSDEIMNGGMDPFAVHSNGVNRYSNINGDSISRYEVVVSYESGTFGKASSLGDCELILPQAPIEIGNRVWSDNDADGIQDADEAGLAGVEVQLVDASSNLVIATCTTDGNGNFYFRSGGVATSGTGTVVCAILPNTDYYVRLKGTVNANGSISGNAGLNGARSVTLSDQLGNGQADWSDNDGTVVGGTGGTYQVSVTTGNYGQSNYNIDFGMKPGVLGVTGLHLEAALADKTVALNWRTLTENNTSHFEPEYSLNGNDFTGTGLQVAAAGNSSSQKNYTCSYLPSTPADVMYFRIKQVDKDDRFTYSNTLSVRFVNGKAKAWPSPFKNEINAAYVVNTPQKIYIRLFDNSSRLVIQRTIVANTGNNQVNLPNLGNLPKGYYSLKISTENGNVLLVQSLFKD